MERWDRRNVRKGEEKSEDGWRREARRKREKRDSAKFYEKVRSEAWKREMQRENTR